MPDRDEKNIRFGEAQVRHGGEGTRRVLVARVVKAQDRTCPKCGSSETRITNSPLPRRYHKCKCGHRFVTIEQRGE